MKTKKLLQSTVLSILMMLLSTFYLNAQIPFQSFDVPNEGIAVWDADGSGPEPEAYGHIHPFGWGSALYYGASRDYDNIDSSANAAMAHLTDTILGFPLFVQALMDNGFTPDQVKIKAGLFTNEDDLEGIDWFTFDNKHYYNRYNAYIFLELSGEPLIKFSSDYLNVNNTNGEDFWTYQSNFATPIDDSEFSSENIQAVATAFLMDMEGAELRMVVDNLQSSSIMGFDGRGRVNGAFFDIHSGYLEKGFSEFPFAGLASDHQGIAAWDADGSGPEPEAEGHTFFYDGTTYQAPYYLASRDYDHIDPDTNAAFSHFTAGAVGFPNTEIQLAYRDFTIDQLKLKCGLTSFGNDIEGMDWGLDSNIHWYNYYAVPIIVEIAGQPILEILVDTSFCFQDMDILFSGWWNYSTYSQITDISAGATADAQAVAASFLKDIGNHLINFSMEGDYAGPMIPANGREGEFHYISGGKMSGISHDSISVNIHKPEVYRSNLSIQIYPNPFFNSTTIEYELRHLTAVQITIYNQLGKQVEFIQQQQLSGQQQIIWIAKGLPNGIYYCVIKTNQGTQTTKLIKL